MWDHYDLSACFYVDVSDIKAFLEGEGEVVFEVLEKSGKWVEAEFSAFHRMRIEVEFSGYEDDYRLEEWCEGWEKSVLEFARSNNGWTCEPDGMPSLIRFRVVGEKGESPEKKPVDASDFAKRDEFASGLFRSEEVKQAFGQLLWAAAEALTVNAGGEA